MYDMELKGRSQFRQTGCNRKLVVAYDGTGYKGFQLQKDQPTIQGAIESALARILSGKVRIYGASRTDAGVHALGQVANFRTESPIRCHQLQCALNAVMPDAIRIRSVENVDDRFHARYSALSKRYRYRLYTGKVVPPFEHRYVCHVPGLPPSAIDMMDQAAGRLVGMTDMACFMSAGSPVRETRREVFMSRVLSVGEEAHFVVEATGFLRHSVRTMVDTLLRIGRGRLTIEDLDKIVRSGRREKSGPPAPAKGLFLEDVAYSGSGSPKTDEDIRSDAPDLHD